MVLGGPIINSYAILLTLNYFLIFAETGSWLTLPKLPKFREINLDENK